MANLSPELNVRLQRLIPKLSSEATGEVIATVDAIKRTLDKAGLDLHDLAARLSEVPRPVHPNNQSLHEHPDLLMMASWLLANSFSRLTYREISFVQNVKQTLTKGRPLSPRQTSWLRDLFIAQKANYND
ncbi:hypothetical protein [Sulfitobacter sp. AS59]|uniref:hypothetical protein n=1 Tax=Sulfitobacter sp. AS59 TaxID=3135784 RepID=UPI0031784CB1